MGAGVPQRTTGHTARIPPRQSTGANGAVIRLTGFRDDSEKADAWLSTQYGRIVIGLIADKYGAGSLWNRFEVATTLGRLSFKTETFASVEAVSRIGGQDTQFGG